MADARGYSWPPFQPGHTLTLRHGARSPRVYGPIALELAAGLVADRPDLAGYPEQVGSWADAEARAALLRQHLDEHGMFDEEGKPRDGQLKWLATFDRLAADRRRSLGLDPASEAALSRDRTDAARNAVDLDRLRALGREAQEGAKARGALTARSDEAQP